MNEQVVLECASCHACLTCALELVPENSTLGEMAQDFFDEHVHASYEFTVRVDLA